MSYDYGPMVYFKAPGPSPLKDVYEVRMTSNVSCEDAGMEHPTECIKTVDTVDGIMHICARCSSVWLIHREVKS